ncbi:hypothetical protein WA026_021125 [Henosepilachna vigintioctopunctata]|uniref:Cuticular protein n=1 Tax=Henosepilachna vigintioctopunctata TaxID=420089 RepID=A0AAW1V3H7_9CUCU
MKPSRWKNTNFLILFLQLFLIGAFLVATHAKKNHYTTPVPILKQINKHNEDGSYSYGYEAADGTFKIETKYPDGEVYGKYGYVDDTGKLREVEYGASKRGFEPSGNDIQVPPPTLEQNQNFISKPDGVDDGQYREDPGVYYRNDEGYKEGHQHPLSIYRQNPQASTQQQTDFRFNWDQPKLLSQYQRQPQYQQPAQYRDHTHYKEPLQHQQPRTQYYQPSASQYDWRSQSHYNSQPSYNPRSWNQFQGHPASNVDIWTGSYSVNYRR